MSLSPGAHPFDHDVVSYQDEESRYHVASLRERLFGTTPPRRPLVEHGVYSFGDLCGLGGPPGRHSPLARFGAMGDSIPSNESSPVRLHGPSSQSTVVQGLEEMAEIYTEGGQLSELFPELYDLGRHRGSRSDKSGVSPASTPTLSPRCGDELGSVNQLRSDPLASTPSPRHSAYHDRMVATSRNIGVVSIGVSQGRSSQDTVPSGWLKARQDRLGKVIRDPIVLQQSARLPKLAKGQSLLHTRGSRRHPVGSHLSDEGSHWCTAKLCGNAKVYEAYGDPAFQASHSTYESRRVRGHPIRPGCGKLAPIELDSSSASGSSFY